MVIGEPVSPITLYPCCVTSSPRSVSRKLPARVRNCCRSFSTTKKPSPERATSVGEPVRFIAPGEKSVTVRRTMTPPPVSLIDPEPGSACP